MVDRLNKAGDGVDVAVSFAKAHSYFTIQSGEFQRQISPGNTSIFCFVCHPF